MLLKSLKLKKKPRLSRKPDNPPPDNRELSAQLSIIRDNGGDGNHD
jgi:hypothetical protein